MNCTKCAQPLDQGAEFCGNCGQAVSDDRRPTNESPTPASVLGPQPLGSVPPVADPASSGPVPSPAPDPGLAAADIPVVETSVPAAAVAAPSPVTLDPVTPQAAPVNGDTAASTVAAPAAVPPAPATLTPPAQPYTAPQNGDRRNNGMAVASLLLGLVAIVTGIFGLGWIAGIIGLVLGIIAVKSQHRGLAIAGIVLSVLGIALSILLIVIALQHNKACTDAGLQPGCHTAVSR